ncbi:hypothetical protein FRB98_002797 [Tulasnella sp. 332]|nr:hypothetical protein FRB98_002797 [Tulasnella sp. 332]
MIILATPTASTSSESPVKSAPSSDWPSNSSETEPLLAAPMVPPPPPYNPEPDRMKMHPPESAGWRFTKAFFAALVIYAVLGLVFGFIMGSHEIIIEGPEAVPRAGDGDIVQCHIPWANYHIPLPWIADSKSISNSTPVANANPPYMSTTSISVPLEQTRLLYFLSKGFLGSGTIRFVTAPPARSNLPAVVVVDITARYWTNQALNKVNMCLLRKEEGAYGVGLYTPILWPVKDKDRMKFNITVTLPASKAHRLTIPALSTDMPNFSHDLHDFTDQVFFESVSLKSSDMPIRVAVGSSLLFSWFVLQLVQLMLEMNLR